MRYFCSVIVCCIRARKITFLVLKRKSAEVQHCFVACTRPSLLYVKVLGMDFFLCLRYCVLYELAQEQQVIICIGCCIMAIFCRWPLPKHIVTLTFKCTTPFYNNSKCYMDFSLSCSSFFLLHIYLNTKKIIYNLKYTHIHLLSSSSFSAVYIIKMPTLPHPHNH